MSHMVILCHSNQITASIQNQVGLKVNILLTAKYSPLPNPLSKSKSPFPSPFLHLLHYFSSPSLLTTKSSAALPNLLYNPSLPFPSPLHYFSSPSHQQCTYTNVYLHQALPQVLLLVHIYFNLPSLIFLHSTSKDVTLPTPQWFDNSHQSIVFRDSYASHRHPHKHEKDLSWSKVQRHSVPVFTVK